VLFLHGFPEIWYSWRHQMLAVAAAGYRAVAPDWRGYGLSDQPPEAEAASYEDLQEDLLALLDALSIPKVAYPASSNLEGGGEIGQHGGLAGVEEHGGAGSSAGTCAGESRRRRLGATGGAVGLCWGAQGGPSGSARALRRWRGGIPGGGGGETPSGVSAVGRKMSWDFFFYSRVGFVRRFLRDIVCL
jgi:predicted alpha/beta hydrolase